MSKCNDGIHVAHLDKSLVHKYRGMCRRCSAQIRVASIQKDNVNICIKCEFGVDEHKIITPRKHNDWNK